MSVKFLLQNSTIFIILYKRVEEMITIISYISLADVEDWTKFSNILQS